MEKLTRRQFNVLSGSAILGFAFPELFSGMSWRGPKIKVGQVGTSHSHAAGKMATLKKLPHIFDVVGIVESDPDKREAAQQETVYQGLKWVTEESLFDTLDIQAVLVETDLEDLVPTALRCIGAGLHVHIDKPPGKSYDELKELLENANAQHLTVQQGYMFRYNPAFQFCLQAVREGWLGEIFEVDGVISKTIKAERRQKLTKTYGGAMMLLGCHLIDILIAILGKPIRLESYRKQTMSDSDHLFDNELAVFEYPEATGTIRSALVEVEGSKRRHLVICGTRGTIEIKPLEPPRLNLALSKSTGKFQSGYQNVALPEMPGRYDEQLLDFARTIRGEKQPDFLMEHDLLVHRVLLQACDLV
jgi:predicted dehydrogenase